MPEAGFGLWIDFNDTGLSHDQLCDRIINRGLLAISGGTTFGREGAGFMRLNVGVPRSELLEGLKRLKNAIL